MNRQDQRNRLEELHALLADVEAQMDDPTLPHSDQQLLDQAWEAYTNEIDDLEAVLEVAEEIETEEWRDATEFLDSEEEDSPPPPPSVTVRAGFTVKDGRVKIVTFAPPPPKIVIPPVDTAVDAPAAPRAAGEFLLPSEEDLAVLNAMVDDRSCARCAGCAYCTASAAYDGADEV